MTVAATFGVVWAMTAPVQAAGANLLQVGQASMGKSPVRIKLNFKAYKNKVITVRTVVNGAEVTVGSGTLNPKGFLDICASRQISSNQTVKIMAGYKQVMARVAQPEDFSGATDICGDFTVSGGTNGTPGLKGDKGDKGDVGPGLRLKLDPTNFVSFLSPGSAALRTAPCSDDPTADCQYLTLTIPSGPPGQAGTNGKDGAPGQNGKDGINGKDGAPGQNGKDGINGKDGAPGQAGKDGINGNDGAPGQAGKDGAAGLSAFEVAKNAGFSGDVTTWLASLRGQAGKSAYDLYKEQNPTSTLSLGDWISSLHGKSAYELAQQVDPTVASMTMADWVQSLHGKDGKTGFEAAGIGAACPIGNSGKTGTYDVKAVAKNAFSGGSSDTADYVLVCKQ